MNIIKILLKISFLAWYNFMLLKVSSDIFDF